jgi:Protein phosphatase 2C
MPIRVRVGAFSLHKDGNSPEDYEDAFWPVRFVDRYASTFRCAVADGATEASFSGAWADMLVRSYCRGHVHADRLLASLAPLQNDWLSAVTSSGPLPWYAEEKLQAGAFAALAGLTIHHHVSKLRDSVRWRAIAIGDSCIFHIRDDALLSAFPLSSAEQFHNSPHLLSSVPARNYGLNGYTRYAAGECRSGDTFYLMTDALSCWFLGAVEAGEKPWCVVPNRDPGCFEEWIGDLRRKHSVRNDDVTVLRVALG